MKTEERTDKLVLAHARRERCRRRAMRWPEALARWCKTYDPQDAEHPEKPFPIRKPQVRKILAHLRESRYMAVLKSRQVQFTWSVMLYQYWLARSRPHALTVVQSQKQDEANRILQRIAFLHDSLPPWMRVVRIDGEWLRLGMEAKFCQVKLHAHRGGRDVLASECLAIPEGADQVRSLEGVTHFLGDEYGFQKAAREAYRATQPVLGEGGQFVAGSTANGKNFFWELCRRPALTQLRIHYSEDPAKDETWVAREQARYLDEGGSLDDWLREFEHSFETFAGRKVFASFRQETHVRALGWLPDRPVIRGWDFGYHRPFCVWMQVHSTGRILFLADVLGREEEIDRFTGRVLALSGEWFPAARFEDWGDIAGEQLDDFGRSPCRYLREQGIKIRTAAQRRETGTMEMRRALRPRLDGIPGLLVDPRAEYCLEGFKGGWRYPEAKPGERVKDELVEDGEHEHAFDACRYAVMGALRAHGREGRRRRKAR